LPGSVHCRLDHSGVIGPGPTVSWRIRHRVDELAALRFQTGLTFARDGRATEALTDFEAVSELYPSSPVADNALLEIARYHFEVTEDLDRAAEYAGLVVDSASYSLRDAAPEAYVVLARSIMARGHTSENLDDALSQLQRGLGLWPDAPAVPQMLFFTGEAHRHAGRFTEALNEYGRVAAEYADTEWAARASLGAGVLRAVTGEAVAALTELQRVRDRWGRTVPRRRPRWSGSRFSTGCMSARLSALSRVRENRSVPEAHPGSASWWSTPRGSCSSRPTPVSARPTRTRRPSRRTRGGHAGCSWTTAVW
jgi:outer membrane protein assembly factor BamD (BamD/ComL family)